ncbi:MAG: G5 domain-containing protein, partial [Candidatus Eremiobacteraeota bacterium]|nr:G5 domain-containing protein [Candidatus Eremiobacteraeota bacterium]
QVSHLTTWQRTEYRTTAMQTIHKIDFTMSPGATKVLSKGVAGRTEVTVAFVQRDDGPIAARVVKSRVIRKMKPRVVVDGVDEYTAFADMEARGVARSAYVAESAMEMVATAYTAGCYGCSGITATGRPAGHGIVAVDPSVIPLGTRLFIPGYGPAIAGDTGGAIRGNRIDLGFNSNRDALLFGRRAITVYRLK